MIYLDYSATTKTDKRVLKRFNEITDRYFANPNSAYKIALESNKIIEDGINNINRLLNIKDSAIIFTSGASESNNTALKGICETYKIKHIISTKYEHSSILAPLNYLVKKGIKVDFVETDEYGIVGLDNLKSLIDDEATLVTIAAVNSELGIREPVEEIGEFLKKYDNVIFHSDITQCLGKDPINLDNIDLASFSGHKIYGFKGIGGLIVKNDVKITPLIHGGKSVTVYRSGTPQTELIDSINTAISLLIPSLNVDIQYVRKLNEKIRKFMKQYDKIHINSNKYSIPHIMNLSIAGYTSDEIQKYFNDNDIYISTKTACSSKSDISSNVYELTNDISYAKSSVRISISKYTKVSEIDRFLKVLKNLLEVNR